MADSHPIKSTAYALGAVVGPVLLVSAFLVLSHRFTRTSTAPDYLALGAAVALGSLCVWLLPLSPRHRVLLLVGYVPLSLLLLVYYMLAFVGVVFGDWL
jgi:hypothetical protein